ncbi:MAG: hypothetical protein HFJ26_04435 [Clostridia bacterium]|jgi:hypothetical protein|nr:hypothetical protein [Clostridia bacterium]
MRKMREENGSITLFVLVSMLFFVLVLAGMYMIGSAKEQTGISETLRIKEIYEKEVGFVDEVYEQIEGEPTPLPITGIYVSIQGDTLGFFASEESARKWRNLL